MTRHDDDIDRRLDEALQVVGPRIPEPRLREAARARIDSMLDAPSAAGDPVPAGRDEDDAGLVRTVHRLRVTVATLAACLGLVATVAIFALVYAGQLRAQVPGAADQPRFVVVNTYDEMCPLAAEVTPVYDELRRDFRDGPVQFIELNLSEGCEQDAQGLAERLGLRCVFQAPLGGQTGVIKLVDTETGEIKIMLRAGEDRLEFEEELIDLMAGDF